jgi:hypothetical protein
VRMRRPVEEGNESLVMVAKANFNTLIPIDMK